MRKTFILTHPKIKVARLFESAKHEIRKYVKRERNRALPKGADFWDFDCRFGPTQEEAQRIHLAEMDKYIDAVEARAQQSFYVDILAKPAHRTKKPSPTSPAAAPDDGQ